MVLLRAVGTSCEKACRATNKLGQGGDKFERVNTHDTNYIGEIHPDMKGHYPVPFTTFADARRVVSVLLTDDQWEEVKTLARREPNKVLNPGSDRQVPRRPPTRGLRHFVSRGAC